MPRRLSPFSLAYFSRFCSVMSLLQAREYLLWRCRSAAMFIRQSALVSFLYFYVRWNIMKVQKRLAEFVGMQVVAMIARAFYIAGLTALIPLIPMVLSPQEAIGARYAFGTALGLIVFGFLIVFWFTESKKSALNALGFMTLFPGLLAVVFSFMGPRRMAGLLSSFGQASPFLEKWAESYVPNAWLLAGVYIIIGVGFIWVSEKVRR